MRTFFALYPGEQGLRGILDVLADLRNEPLPVKWEKADHIHITIKFIAEIVPSALRRIIDDVREEIRAMDAIPFQVTKIDAFPNARKPRIIWLGGTEIAPVVMTVQQRVEDASYRSGVARERNRFTPHFTIGRVTSYGEVPDLKNALDSVSFMSFKTVFRDLRIMESTLSPKGAIHKEVDRIPFEH